MRLGFDLDGVIADGKYLDLSKIPIGQDVYSLYQDLDPYEPATVAIWNALCKDHDCWIITARGSGKQSPFKNSLDSVIDWLQNRNFTLPRGIFTGVRKSDKTWLCQDMNLDMYIDDSTSCFEAYNPTFSTRMLLMNNPLARDNQEFKHPFIPRVNSWPELLGRIKHMEQIIERSTNSELHEPEPAL